MSEKGPFGADPEAFFSAFYLRTPGARAVYEDSLALLRRLAAVEAGDRALDIGCGGGHLLRELVADGAFAIGIDRSAGMAALARRVAPGVATVVADSGNLPFGEGAFDVVLSRAHLQHVDGLEATLRECARVLKKHGRLLVFVPVTHPVVAVARAIAAVLVPARREVSGTLRHASEYVRRIAAAGLVVELAQAYGFVVYAASGYGTGISVPLVPGAVWRCALAVDRALLRLPGLRRLGIDLVVVARKA